MAIGMEPVLNGRRLRASEEIAKEVTTATIESFKAHEKSCPGVVHTAIAMFRPHYDPQERNELPFLPPGQPTRQRQHEAARRNMESAQRKVLDWLRSNDRSVQGCFADSRDFRFDVRRHVWQFPVANAMVLAATSQLVQELRQFDDVLLVREDFSILSVPEPTVAPLKAVELLAGPAPEAEHAGGYTWGWSLLNLKHIHSQGYRGIGIRVGVIDSGAVDRHPDLHQKVKDFAKVDGPSTVVPAHCFDPLGHGTACSGVIVGGNNGGTQIGGAPEAELVAVSMMDGNRGMFSHLVAALEWLSDPYRSVSVINLSLGASDLPEHDQAWLEEIVDRFLDNNVVVVAAIGNDRNKPTYPGKLPNVLACGALEPYFDDHDNRQSRVWEKSADGPDLVLPGTYVYSSVPPLRPRYGGRDYTWFSGTSLAAAHCSGLVALLMQADRRASARLVVDSLLETATPLDGDRHRFGRGVPSFYHALSFIRGWEDRKMDLRQARPIAPLSLIDAGMQVAARGLPPGDAANALAEDPVRGGPFFFRAAEFVDHVLERSEIRESASDDASWEAIVEEVMEAAFEHAPDDNGTT